MKQKKDAACMDMHRELEPEAGDSGLTSIANKGLPLNSCLRWRPGPGPGRRDRKAMCWASRPASGAPGRVDDGWVGLML